MKFTRSIWTLSAIVMVLSMCFAGLCLAQEEQAAEPAQEAAVQEEVAATEETAAAEEAAVPEEADAPQQEIPAEVETVVAAQPLKVIGEENIKSLKVELTNNTGKDISYLSVNKYSAEPMADDSIVKMQKALIEQGFLDDVADGSAGPKTQAAIAAFREDKGLPAEGGADEEMLKLLLGNGWDGNLLEEGDVFAAGETRMLYVAAPTLKAENAADAENALTQALKAFDAVPTYVLSFRAADAEKVYDLYVFPAESMDLAELCLDGETAYISYQTKVDEVKVSTLEAEKAAAEALKAPEVPETVVTEDAYAAYDYSYDTSYDYNYDASYAAPVYEEPVYEEPAYQEPVYEEPVYEEPVYEEPVYEEPAYEAPYIVFQEDYPSCDDGSHGVTYIEWSDGTTQTIEY
ncbi:MAG: peptidoglycan-binding protein [Parasporobacterium sp.]|nr:peptidoglycan-binding protein [Parasporobacterium sp.]